MEVFRGSSASAKAAAAMLDLLDGLLFLTDFLLDCCFFALAIVFFSANCCFLVVAFGVVPGVDTEKERKINSIENGSNENQTKIRPISLQKVFEH